MRAFLFDLDGTLIDSMPHHQSAWDAWHVRHGLPMDSDGFFAATAGRSNPEILVDLFPDHSADEIQALADEKEGLYREIAARSLGLIPGAQSFVERARAARLPLAVCTAATPLNMALAFDRHGIDRWVDTVVSPADGLRGKPHPDIFLEAARRLGLAPADCLVFEDAPLGIEAARRAGMKAIALTTTLPAAAFAAYDNVLAIAADFTALDPLLLARAPAPEPKGQPDA
ncbi:MAG: HAD family phosphatase [Pseudomonadota bacterium]|nr:HAD family phosphatase [Pseudomonadota bacterium]